MALKINGTTLSRAGRLECSIIGNDVCLPIFLVYLSRVYRTSVGNSVNGVSGGIQQKALSERLAYESFLHALFAGEVTIKY